MSPKPHVDIKLWDSCNTLSFWLQSRKRNGIDTTKQFHIREINYVI